MADREDTRGIALGAADTLPSSEPTADLEDTPGPDRPSADQLLRDIARIDEAPPPPSELVGTRLACFEVLAVLGRGGMGVVYLAADHRLGRKVALKLIRGDPGLATRLLREARAQARVDHPGGCKVFEAGEAEGKAYIDEAERLGG
jgi:serine/threonine protein kinase